MKTLYFFCNRNFLFYLLCFALTLNSVRVTAQSTWSSSASTSDWSTAGNWSPSAVPAVGTVTQFNSSNPSTGVTFSATPTASAISVLAARTSNLSFGSSSASSYTFTFGSGTTINGITGTVISNLAGGSTPATLTLQNGSGTMTYSIGSSGVSRAIVAGAGSSATTVGNIIAIPSAFSGVTGSSIAFYGSGTWNGTSGNCGGLLKLSGNYTVPTTTVGSPVTSSGTANSGILELDANTIPATAVITVNRFSQLYLNASSGTTFTTTGNLTLRGSGSNSSTIGQGALAMAGGNSYTWAGNVVLDSGAVLQVPSGNTTFSLTGTMTGTATATYAPVINIGAGSTTATGSVFVTSGVISGSGTDSFLCNGTFNGSTGNFGGLLRQTGTPANNFTGSVVIGRGDGTSNGVFEMDNTNVNAFSSGTGGTIIINPYSQLYLNGTSGTSYTGGTTGSLTLNGSGPNNNLAATGRGALFCNAKTFSLSKPLSLNSAMITCVGGTNQLTFSGATAITGSNIDSTGPGSSATASGNQINFNGALSGSGSITFLGGGTWNGSSGVAGGILKLNAANTNSGGITVGKSDGTSSGILYISAAGAASTNSSNSILINANSQLYLGLAGSVTAGGGTLTLNGNGCNVYGRGAFTTVSGFNGTWPNPIALGSYAVINSQGSGSTVTLTLSNSISQSSYPLTFVTGAGSGTAQGSAISLTGAMSGTVADTFLGSGTWNGTSGNSGGILKLANSSSTFSGGFVVGYPDGTMNGILQLDSLNSIYNSSSNFITINSNSALYLDYLTSGTSYATGNVTLNLNGNGSNYASASGGALINKSGFSYTWPGPIALASNATISAVGTATLTLSGNVTGAYQLTKAGAGTLSLTGTTTSWTGGTLASAGTLTVGSGATLGTGATTINGGSVIVNSGSTLAGQVKMVNGSLTVNSGAALSTSSLPFLPTSAVTNTVTFNNATQSIGTLSSTFGITSGTSTQKLVLNGTVLTINQTADSSFGVGAASTLTSTISGTGKIIKNGTGALILSGATSSYANTGGMDVNSGKILVAGTGLSIGGGINIYGGEVRINATTATTTLTSSAFTLSGGALNTTGISTASTITLGTLNLQANSSIDLGTAAVHSVKFAASGALTWATGAMLTVTNWTGTYGAGTTGTEGKLFIGTSNAAASLTSTQLAQIQFQDPSGNIFQAQQLSTGEVVPKAPAITTTTAPYGPLCNSASNTISVGFTSTATLVNPYKVQLSYTNGNFPSDTSTNIIGSGTSSPISAVIASGDSTSVSYRVRVLNGSPVVTFASNNNGSNIILNSPTSVGPISGASAILPTVSETLTSSPPAGTWSSSNTSVATINPTTGVVTGVSRGTAIISYTDTVCGSYVSATDTLVVTYFPIISSITPQAAKAGDTIILTGNYFNATAANNIVYMGGVKGTVLTASSTSLSVKVDTSSLYGPISVENSVIKLEGTSEEFFTPVFKNDYFNNDTVNFKQKVDFTVGTGPNIAAIGDLDGDGKADFVSANTGAGTITVYHNNNSPGPGTINSSSFSAVTTLSASGTLVNVKVADLDGDGKLDILATSSTTSRLYLFHNNSTPGSISFSSAIFYSTVSGSYGGGPQVVAVADVDQDGKPDVIVSTNNSSYASIAIFKNTTTSGVNFTSGSLASVVTFPLAISATPSGISAVDFDGDGKPDIAVANQLYNTASVYLNTSSFGVINSSSLSSSPVTLTTGTYPTDLQSADINGDGLYDIMVTNPGSSSVSVFQNTSSAGSLSFNSKVDFTASTAVGVAAADFTGDGLVDLAVTEYSGANIVSVFRNIGSTGSTISSSTFASPLHYATGATPTGVVAGDLDGDGYPEILTGNSGSNTISVIRDYPLPYVPAIQGHLTVCQSGGTDTLTDSLSGGFWMMSNSNATINASTGVITGVTAGLDTAYYFLQKGGDTNYVMAQITVNPLPTVYPISGNATLCVSTYDTLSDLSGAGTWLLSNNTIATISLSGIVTGISIGNDTALYTVTNVATGCSDTVEYSLTVNHYPTAGTITGATLCSGSSVTLTSVGGDSVGVWSSNDSAIAGVTSGTGIVTGNSGGTAIISYTISNSCATVFDTALINVLPAYSAGTISGSFNVCSIGGTTTLTDSISGGTWTSSNTSLATVNAAGIVTGVALGSPVISYTIVNACGTFTTSATVIVQSVSASITSAAMPCYGYSTNIVFTGTSGATFSYSVDSGTALTDTLTGGTYTLTTGAVTASSNYMLLNVTSGGCVVSLDTTVTIAPQAMQWVGGASGNPTDWNTAANWSCGTVPGSSDNVIIPSTSHKPKIATGSSIAINSLTINNGGHLTISGTSVVTVSSNVVNNDTITGSGTLILGGANNQLISGVGVYNSLKLNNYSGATIDTVSSVTIDSVLTIASGTFTTADSLILSANANTTASIAALPAGASISGNVSVFTYSSAGRRAFRFWSHPFSTPIPLSQLEQYIDVTGYGGSLNGFTGTNTNSPSAFRYDPLRGNSSIPYDPGWQAFTSCYTTDTNGIQQYEGIRLFIRGSKGQGLDGNPYTPSAAVIGMYGPVNQGNQTIHLTKGTTTLQDYNQVGNPYPSPVDIGTVIYNASVGGNINGSMFYVFNPFLGSAGQYQGIPISSTPYYLSGSCAFQVRAAHNGDSLNFTESNKAPTATYDLLKQVNGYTTLYIYDTQYHPWDLWYLQFNNSATSGEDTKYDGGKILGTDLSFYSIAADSAKLNLDSRPYTTGGIIPLSITSSYSQDFIIKAENIANDAAGKLYLHDKLLKQYVLLQQGTEYRFSITNDKVTQGNNRFEISMEPVDVPGPRTSQLTASIVPNPATDVVKVSFTNGVSENVSVRMLDISGITLFANDLGTQQNGSFDLSLTGLPAGIYMVEITSGNRKVLQKLIKE